MGFLANLFLPKNQDMGSVAAHFAALVALAAASPAGQTLLGSAQTAIDGSNPTWMWAAGIFVSYLLGARAGQPKKV